MNPIPLHRHHVVLHPQSDRVILRPFIPSDAHRVATIIGRALALSETEADLELAALSREFRSRHFDFEPRLLAHYALVEPHVFTQRPLTNARKQLLGALFSGEYALESAALFNPSMVAHPDQSGVAEGDLRFVMSLRATGEGHISSIEFRSGTIERNGSITVDPTSNHVTMPEILPNPTYHKEIFSIKLREMGLENDFSRNVLAPLADDFVRSDLDKSIDSVRQGNPSGSGELNHTIECVQWLADSNYEIRFQSRVGLSERILFPVSPNESNGIEDARFVKFTEEDGSTKYCATYTAYNGREILPQFIETKDFLHFRVITLNGRAVQNKGMALFPRRVGGRYAMLSRQDDENLLLMLSDNLHYWNDPQILMRPAQTWESVKIGNCGSPLETKAGWLVITHGVGPMRKYCIGAALLDLDDPSRIIGRLREPLLSPEGIERDGYVPNVVYSCGSLLHGGNLILPYAMSDKATKIASVPLEDLLKAMTA